MSSFEPPLSAIVLAAGQGARMRSDRPKPLHRLCGRPMLAYVLDAVSGVMPERAVIVVGHKGDWVSKRMGEESTSFPVEFVEQRVQRGTGDATEIGLVGLPDELDDDDEDVLVVSGDAPLLRAATLAALVARHREADVSATLLTFESDDATAHGRVVRGRHQEVISMVQQIEDPGDQAATAEVGAGVYCFRRSVLAPALRRLEPDNALGEFYLSDVVEVLARAGHAVQTFCSDDPLEMAGVNDRMQLAVAERELRRRTNERWMRTGVTMVDPSATYVDTTVEIGRDVTLFPGVFLQGSTVVGDGCELGPNTRLIDSMVGAGCVITETTGRRAHIGEGAEVGPYAMLQPGSSVPAHHRAGPFYTATADD